MIDPSDLDPTDIEDHKLEDLARGYLEGGATLQDWAELLMGLRDLGYHVGYQHGKEDVELGVYGKREEFTND
ncbi:hypothetical protein [Pseudomonas sp.]|uniref:hypothetical protein n=1 Tax=Pseudomonas sp. TaxID=306 RepID=UPI003D0A9CC2